MKRFVEKLSTARADHRKRHRPTGFGFALADSIAYLDAARWDALVGPASFFLSRRYLAALEVAAPENVEPRYAMVFRGATAVAAVAVQVVAVRGSRLVGDAASNEAAPPASGLRGAIGRARRKLGRARRKLGGKAIGLMKSRIVVCGNLLSWGPHGVAFAPGEDPAALWPAVAEALYRIRRAERLSGESDFAMVKDVPESAGDGAAALKRFGYRSLQTDPDMVLDLLPAWRRYDDYANSLASKYRKAARQIAADVEAAGCRVESLASDEIERHAERLHALYLQVHERARVRPVTLSPGYLPALAAAAGDELRCTVVRRDGELFGFVTTLKDGDTAIGYYIGLDYAVNASVPLYLRLLHAVVGDAIALGCRRLSLGRTALEPKARLGCRPEPLRIWLRHRLPVMNLVVRQLLRAVPHDEPPERNPFKGG